MESAVDIAVLSDIHSNYIALEKCIEYAVDRGIRTFVFLGDYVGELAYPQKTMEIIYEMSAKYECYFIRGNKEDYWIEYQKNGEYGWRDKDSTTGSLLYAYTNLSKKDLDFFKGLPISKKLSFDNMPFITICHGSPNKVNQKLLHGNDQTYEIMDTSDTSIIICGHTHIQDKIVHNGKRVLNAGSVGVPLHSDGQSQFIILHGNEKCWEEEFISLEYDIERVIKELHTSGLNRHAPYWCIVTEQMLRKGIISHGEVLERAMALCRAEIGGCIWPHISEVYWEQAVSEMIRIPTIP